MAQDNSSTMALAPPAAIARQQEVGAPAGRVAASPSAIPPVVAAKPKRSPRRFLLPLIALGIIGYGGHWAYGYFVEGRFIVSTDDAYVGANTAIIAAKVSGFVTDVAVSANQSVHTGELMAKIDDGDYKLAVDAAKAKVDTQDATIARIGRQVEAQRAMIAQADAQVGSAKAQQLSMQADHERASLEYDRSQKLAQNNFGSQQRLEQANADNARSNAQLAGSAASLASAQAGLAGAKANLEVMQAQQMEATRTRAELVNAQQRAERDLSFTEVRAPFNGVVGNRAIEVGQYAQPGGRLLALVPLDTAFVDANFKETQLDTIKPGQKVEVAVDAFGGRVIEGKVVSVSPASGAQFSLLPPDNATGNFTKVVQRVAVRIGFDPETLKRDPLRPGLSVVASVHTRDESLPKPTLFGALGLRAEARP